MSSTTYPFDPTGLATSNLITNEPHLLTEIAVSASEVSYNEFHLLIPDCAPFFATGFILNHVTGGTIVPLVRGTDYELCLPYLDASRSTLKDIFGGISVLKQYSNGLLKITYQTVGGDWIADVNHALLAAFNQPWFNIRATTWDVLTDRTNKFPVINHDNSTDYIDGHQSLVEAINLASIDIESAPSMTLASVNHFLDINNPHHVTKVQVGLSDVVDVPPASLVEARTFKKVDKYATMAAVMEFLKAFKKQVAIVGPSTITAGTSATFTIINYRPYVTYNVTVTGGTAVVTGNTITVTPTTPSTMMSVNVNGTVVPIYSRPVNTPAVGSVTISGNRTVGMTLTATNNITDTDGLGPFHYQWYSGTTPVGSDTDTYVSVVSDITNYITCVISFQDKLEYAESITSNRFGPIRKVDSLPTGSVIINGITTVFETLTVDTSSLADTNTLGSLHYEWFADGVAIGTDSPSYTLQHDDRKKRVTCRVSYQDGDEYTDSITSAPTALIRDYDHLPLGDVTIPTTAIFGTTLVATNTITDENGLGALHYQWYVGTTPVGTDNPTYTPVFADIGSTISCVVTYTDSDNYTDSVTSNSTDPVKDINHAPTGTATVDGTAQVGETLSVTNSIADQNGLGSFNYQWYSGTTQVGTNSNSYTVQSSDLGNKITCVITYTDGDGYSNTYNVTTGTGTTSVIPPNAAPQGNVVIVGVRNIGDTVTADISNVTDADGITTIVSYDWFMWLTDFNTGQHTPYSTNLLQSGTSNKLTIPAMVPGNVSTIVNNWIGVALRYIDGKGVASVVYSDDAVDCTSANAVTDTNSSGGGTGGGGGTTPNGTAMYMNGVATYLMAPIHLTGTGEIGSNITANLTIQDASGNPVTYVSNTNMSPSIWWYKDGTLFLSNYSKTYKPVAGDLGAVITAHASYLDVNSNLQNQPGDNSITVIAATGGGSGGGSTNVTGNIIVTGASQVGGKLSVTYNSLADADGLGTFHYQWMSGTTKVGTDSVDYSVLLSDVGKVVTCVVSYTDGKGNLESKTSNPLGPIVVPDLSLIYVDNGVDLDSLDKTGVADTHLYTFYIKLSTGSTIADLLPTLTNVVYHFKLDRQPAWYGFDFWDWTHNYANATLEAGTVMTGTVTANDASGATVNLTGTNGSNVITANPIV